MYTAFGELVSGTSGRFGYVGAHGYQTSDEMPYQHVGNRYYDPTTGRFLQRDPMGITGGQNVYGYVNSSPTWRIDSDGLTPDCAHNPNIPGDGPFTGPPRIPDEPPDPGALDVNDGILHWDDMNDALLEGLRRAGKYATCGLFGLRWGLTGAVLSAGAAAAADLWG